MGYRDLPPSRRNPSPKVRAAMVEWLARWVELKEDRGQYNPPPAKLTRQEAAELLNVTLREE